MARLFLLLLTSLVAMGCGQGGAGDVVGASAAETAAKPILLKEALAKSLFFLSLSNGERGVDVVLFVPPDAASTPDDLKPGDVLVGPAGSGEPEPRTVAVLDGLAHEMGSAGSWSDPISAFRFEGATFQASIVKNDTGFVRKLVEAPIPHRTPQGTSVYLLVTERVSLGDALGDTPTPRNLDDEDGVTFSGKITKPLADVASRELYSQDGVTLTLTRARLLSGFTIDTLLRVRNHKADRFKVVLQGTLDTDLEVSLRTSGSFEKDVRANIFSTSYILPAQLVGSVPLVETVKVSAEAHCHVSVSGDATLTMGAKAHEALTLGASYEGGTGVETGSETGTWTNLSKMDNPTFTAVGPSVGVSAKASVMCEIVPKVSILFYDVVGPYVTITPSATLSVDADATAAPDTATAKLAWKLDAAVSAELGVDLNPGVKALIPPGDLDKMRRTLFERKATLRGGSVGN